MTQQNVSSDLKQGGSHETTHETGEVRSKQNIHRLQIERTSREDKICGRQDYSDLKEQKRPSTCRLECGSDRDSNVEENVVFTMCRCPGWDVIIKLFV